jgi:two-component system, OmpR family, response regulator
MATDALRMVMLVEDEPDIQTVAKIALEKIGNLVVAVCGSGAEAVKAVQNLAPDIILLDVMMPGMDGPTTLTKLRQIPDLDRTPVVFMTAKVQPDEIERYKKLGAVDVIKKPFDPMTLSGTVRDIWSRHNGNRAE